MSKKYTVKFANGDGDSRSRKDAAIKLGEESGMAFQVFSPSGALVHDAASDVNNEIPEPPEEDYTEFPDEDPAPEPEEEADEDLIGDVTVDVEPEPEKGARKFDVTAMKAKISKLLAKAEKTDNEKEREAFNEKAEHLMIQLGINAAELEAAGEIKPEEIVEVHRDFPGNYSIVMIPFVHDVASGFGNLTVLQSSFPGKLTRRAYIIGHKSDVERFTQLLDSLSLQVMHALHAWQREHIEERRGLTDMEKYIQHRSFISGFGQEVGRRLFQLREMEEEQVSTGAALVLASKQDRINSWMDETYPKLGKARGGMKYHSSVAMSHGRTAGKTANLGEKSVGGKRGELAK